MFEKGKVPLPLTIIEAEELPVGKAAVRPVSAMRDPTMVVVYMVYSGRCKNECIVR